MVANDIRTSQKLKSKGQLSIEKNIKKCKQELQGVTIRFQVFSYESK